MPTSLLTRGPGSTQYLFVPPARVAQYLLPDAELLRLAAPDPASPTLALPSPFSTSLRLTETSYNLRKRVQRGAHGEVRASSGPTRPEPIAHRSPPNVILYPQPSTAHQHTPPSPRSGARSGPTTRTRSPSS